MMHPHNQSKRCTTNMYIATGAAPDGHRPMAKISQNPCQIDWPSVRLRMKRLVQARRA